MKLLVTVFVALATILSTNTQASAINHEPHYKSFKPGVTGEPRSAASFSVQLDRQGIEKRVRLVIENPGRKNLYVSLNGPDGTAIDDFFTGKKTVRLNKIYNFSVAEAGLYSIEVRYGTERIKKQIRLEYVDAHPVDYLTIEQ